MDSFETLTGKPLPLGATPCPAGTQFAIFSRHATAVSLILFETPEDTGPLAEIEFDPEMNRTGDIWHICVKGVGPGQLYLYRVDGPHDPEAGHRFDRNKLLLDPYAKAVTGNRACVSAGTDSQDTGKDLRAGSKIREAGYVPMCIVINDDFDWQGDKPLNFPLRFCVIYETHVGGLTRHKSAGVQHPGNFKGVVEIIPFFKELGITSLELLPVQEFDEFENRKRNPITGEMLQNYWGYSTIAFFAPKGGYSSSGFLGQQVTEFKEMVRELHRAGIEVILDVVFNHTAEGDETGPALSFKGLDNSIYYILDDDRRFYKNYTGCKNTLNCNHPTVRNMILDCLHYWVVEMHVDGFRFDLGSVLGRSRNGDLLENPPVLERIAEDPILRHTKIIAEAWDTAGAYQVGWFPGGRWAEWNDRFKNDVRHFWRGDPGFVPNLATRITGSADLYLRDGRKPFHSINFITSHDGFTLNDLVSYREKHNIENGEDERDGTDNIISCNYGVEGETDNTAVQEVRERQIKNFLATLFLSLGTPMLLGGDEFRRTQRGNNNPYCHNSELTWYNWDFLSKHGEIFHFCRELISFRKRHHTFQRPEFYSGEDSDHNMIPDITWFNEEGGELDWTKTAHTLSLRIDGSKAEIEADRDDNDLFMIFNASSEKMEFTVCPAPGGKKWFLAIDTALHSPEDIKPEGEETLLDPREIYKASSRSLVVLISR